MRKRKRLLSSEARYKLFTVVRVHLGLPVEKFYKKQRWRKLPHHLNKWGCSSAGRAPALQAGGHGFESHHLHQGTKVPQRWDLRPFAESMLRFEITLGWDRRYADIFKSTSSPPVELNFYKVSLVTFLFKESNMLIENRIRKRNEQIVVYWEKLVI